MVDGVRGDRMDGWMELDVVIWTDKKAVILSENRSKHSSKL